MNAGHYSLQPIVLLLYKFQTEKKRHITHKYKDLVICSAQHLPLCSTILLSTSLLHLLLSLTLVYLYDYKFSITISLLFAHFLLQIYTLLHSGYTTASPQTQCFLSFLFTNDVVNDAPCQLIIHRLQCTPWLSGIQLRTCVWDQFTHPPRIAMVYIEAL